MKCENEINVLKQNGTLLVTCHVKEETTRGTNPQLPRTTPVVRKSRYFITSSPSLRGSRGQLGACARSAAGGWRGTDRGSAQRCRCERRRSGGGAWEPSVTEVPWSVKGHAGLFSGGISKAKEVLEGHDAQTDQGAAWGGSQSAPACLCWPPEGWEAPALRHSLCFRDAEEAEGDGTCSASAPDARRWRHSTGQQVSLRH